MEIITSAQNNKIKTYLKLQKAKQRYKHQQYTIEGWHLIEEAFNHQMDVQWVFMTQAVADTNQMKEWIVSFENTTQFYVISNDLVQLMKATETSQGIFACIGLQQLSLDDYFLKSTDANGPLLILDGIQDPGNAGTMIRSAKAFNFSGVIFSKDSVDPYNDKLIRSTQGMLFELPLMTESLEFTYEFLIKMGYTIYVTDLNEEAIDLQTATFKEKTALVIGNEGQGISELSRSFAHQSLVIPMNERVESLNAGVAASIAMYTIDRSIHA
ncbi:TrmH family RNA methyltransferase [Atopobacter phocae]|uniref:TrmH family RNA methyltransferase n=1 Tax=Atopobacter phocae TaxID=136492 RepID=UPI00046F052F|nr:RNA methyltransferase [Atopobacter phocae]